MVKIHQSAKMKRVGESPLLNMGNVLKIAIIQPSKGVGSQPYNPQCGSITTCDDGHNCLLAILHWDNNFCHPLPLKVVQPLPLF
jgi:hypothetical protein